MVIVQEWHDVLFLHWPVTPGALRPHVPAPLKIALYSRRQAVTATLPELL